MSATPSAAESARLCLLLAAEERKKARELEDAMIAEEFARIDQEEHEEGWGGPKRENRTKRDGTSKCYRWLAKGDLMTKTGYGYAKCLTVAGTATTCELYIDITRNLKISMYVLQSLLR